MLRASAKCQQQTVLNFLPKRCRASDQLHAHLADCAQGGAGAIWQIPFGRPLPNAPCVAVKLIRMSDIVGMAMDFVSAWVGLHQSHAAF